MSEPDEEIKKLRERLHGNRMENTYNATTSMKTHAASVKDGGYNANTSIQSAEKDKPVKDKKDAQDK